MANDEMLKEIMDAAGLAAQDTEPAGDAQAEQAPAVEQPESVRETAAEPETDATAAGLESTEGDRGKPDADEKAGKPGRPNDESDDDEDEETPRVSKRALKRARYENRVLRKQLEDMKRERSAAPARSADTKPAEVKRSAFQSDEDYIEAVVRTRMAEERAAAEIRNRETLERMEQDQENDRQWAEKIFRDFPTKEAQDEYDDAISTFGGDVGSAIGVSAGEYVFQHAHGPKILRYLADHPTTCERLKNGHPFDQAQIMARIVEYVERAPSNPAANAEGGKPARKPAAPTGSIRTGGSAPASTRSAEELFMDAIR